MRFANALQFWRDLSAPRAVRLRLALEELGPIFVCSARCCPLRRDLIPMDIADELAKLQDRVPLRIPPCPGGNRKGLRPLRLEVFAEFDPVPVASAPSPRFLPASRPRTAATSGGRKGAAAQHAWRHRPRPGAPSTPWPCCWKTVVRQQAPETPGGGLPGSPNTSRRAFDLIAEAGQRLATAAQFRRIRPAHRARGPPGDWGTSTVMVMERMQGTPISQIDRLRGRTSTSRGSPPPASDLLHPGLPRRLLPRRHAPRQHLRPCRRPLHRPRFRHRRHPHRFRQELPGAEFLAFFRRDYKRVAEAHIESGWAPKDTRVDEFGGRHPRRLRTHFRPPLKEISFGRVLLRLFQTSRRFNVEIQPQLVMLQKTLLNIEGLGRQATPTSTCGKPPSLSLERWMSEQVGWRGLLTHLRRSPYLAGPCRNCRAWCTSPWPSPPKPTCNRNWNA